MSKSPLRLLTAAAALLCLVTAGQAFAGITGAVSAGGVAPEPVEVGTGLADGSLYFVDRTHAYANVPAWLVGSDHVRTANDDKGAAGYTLDVTVDVDGILLVFMDDRFLPYSNFANLGWLSAYADTGWNIDIDESADGDIDQTFSILAMDVLAGTHQTLAPGGGNNMYVVAFVPAGTEIPAAVFAPNGWIQTQAWNVNYFGTSCNPASSDPRTCAGCGGAELLGTNWVAPHDLSMEDPRAGDDWSDVALVAAGVDTGPSDLRIDGVWRTVSYVKATTGLALPTGDVVDSQAILTAAGLPEPSTNDVFAVATTYVENTTGANKLVGICTASDDSIRVDINDATVANVSACRGTAADCAEIAAVELLPGVSKITVYNHEGGGGFGFRFALLGNGGARLGDGNGEGVVLLGPGADGDGLTGQTGQPASFDPNVEFNAPNAWIQADAWSLTFPVDNQGGCNSGGSGEELVRIANNSIAPTSIGANWGSGDTIDRSAGEGVHYAAAIPGIDDGLAISTRDIETATGVAMPHSSDVIDYQNLVDRLNPAVGNILPGDNVLGIGRTYVTNNTGAPLDVGICSASDDSIVVYVNDQLVTVQPLCRGTAGDCAEVLPAVLMPGPNKITTFTYEGGGGWGFRLAIVDGSGAKYRDFLGDGTLTFDGPNPPAGTPESTFALNARVADGCPPGEVGSAATVTLLGNGGGEGEGADAADPITVTEQIIGGVAVASDSATQIIPSAVSDDLNAFGFIRRWVHLGPYLGAGADPGAAVGDDWMTDGVGTTEDNFDFFDGNTVNTDYAVAASTDISENGGRNPGHVPTATEGVDADDTINYDDYYGGNVDNIAMYSATFVDLLADTDVVVAAASDDSLVVKVDNVEVIRHNGGRGYGAANEVQNRSGVVSLTAGLHKIMVKVFDGGGGHGFRLRLEDVDGNPVAAPDQIRVCNYDGTLCQDGSQILAQTLVWETTVGAANAGLSYDVSFGGDLEVNPNGSVAGSTAGLVGPSAVNLPRDRVQVGDFISTDLGFVARAGFTAVSKAAGAGDVYTVAGSGGDIWDNGDDGHFAYQEVSGDFDAVARIVAVTNSDGTANLNTGRWGRYGIMARYDCSRDGKYSFANTPYRGEVFADGAGTDNDTRRHQSRYRHHSGGGTVQSDQALGAGQLPNDYTGWVKLSRRGDYLFSSWAQDTTEEGGDPSHGPWKVAGGDTHEEGAPDTMLVGFCVGSHGTISDVDGGQALLAVTFDNYSVSKPDAAAEFALGNTINIAIDQATIDAFSITADNIPPDDANPFDPAVVDFAGTNVLRILSNARGSVAAGVYFPLGGQNLGTNGFQMNYRLHRSKDGGADPADGGGLAVYNGALTDGATVLGGAGGGMGYQRGGRDDIPASRPYSLFVEHDNWGDGGPNQNSTPGQGANQGADGLNHLALAFSCTNLSAQSNQETGAALPNNYSASIAELGPGMDVRLTYVPQPGQGNSHVTVEVKATDDTEYLTAIDAYGPQFDGDITPAFVGGTGGATMNFDISQISITPVSCIEIPDSIAVSGATEAEINTDVLLTAETSGADGAVTVSWEIVSEVDGGGAAATLTDNGDGTATLTTDTPSDVTVRATMDDGKSCSGEDASDEITVTFTGLPLSFIRGDANNDGEVNISDPQYTLNFLFLGGPAHPCAVSANSNGDAEVNISDPQFTLNFLFLGGPPPPAPYPTCGVADDLATIGCATPSAACGGPAPAE